MEDSMSITNVTNPGLVNVADQGYDGLVSVDQTKTVAPATTAQRSVSAADGAPGRDSTTFSPSIVSAPMTAQLTVEGGVASPTSPNVVNTIEDTVVNQPTSVQQYSDTVNVFV
jgi:hypothetical protein